MQRVLLGATALLPTPAQGAGCRTAATVIPPYSPSAILLTPPPLQTCLLSYELCIVIIFWSLLHSLKSFCHSRLVTSPGKWEQQLPRGRSCRPCPPLPLAAATRRAAVPWQPPAASRASHSLLHRENHRQNCVFQREALVQMRQMVLTASRLLHCSLKTRCGLWFATRFLQSWPYPNKMFLPPQTSSEIHSWHFLTTITIFWSLPLCSGLCRRRRGGEDRGNMQSLLCIPLEADPNDITAACSFFALVLQLYSRDPWFSPADDCMYHLYLMWTRLITSW